MSGNEKGKAGAPPDAGRRAGGRGEATAGAKRKKRETALALDPKKLQEAALASILRRMRDGKKPTAAELAVLKEAAAREAEREQREAMQAEKDRGEAGAEPNRGYSLEEDLEEWALQDGAVRGSVRRLSAIAAEHRITGEELEKELWKVQRKLLMQYGFESTKKSGPLTGAESQATEWLKSIGQIAQISREWHLQMQGIRRARETKGQTADLESLNMLNAMMAQMTEKRNSLMLRVRELGAKEKRAGTGRGQKAMSFEIVMGGEMSPSAGAVKKSPVKKRRKSKKTAR